MKKITNWLRILTGVSVVVPTVMVVTSCGSNKYKINGNVKQFKSAKAAENSGASLVLSDDFSTGFKTKADITRQQNNGTPFGKYWMPNGQSASDFDGSDSNDLINSFLDYKPSEDKDAKYNVGSVKLNESKVVKGSNDVQDKTGNVRHHAMGVVNKNTSGTPAQGSYQFDNYNFTNWAYVDEYTAWAGAINEGIIIIPTADIIDAAHKNGTEIMGIIYFDGYFGLTQQTLERFFEKDSQGNYKIVDKLIEVAEFFGFDGWFWNNEANATTNIVNEEDVTKVMEQYVKKVKDKKSNLKITMYTDHGGLAANNNKTNLAKGYLDGGADSYISDFIPSVASDVDDYIKQESLEKYRFKNHNMININKAKDEIENGNVNFDSLLKVEGEQQKEFATSFATFALADTYKDFTASVSGTGVAKSLNVAQKFREYDNLLFSGKTGDPSKLTDPANGSGIASVINERSTLTSEEFVTNFSTGQGIRFYDNGKLTGDSIWNHRGVMDVMPTYQWIVDNSAGNNFSADFTYTKAFNKGNALRMSSSEYDTNTGEYKGGTLKSGGSTSIKLFGGEMLVSDQQLSIKLSAASASKDLLGQSNNSLDVEYELEFSDGTKSKIKAENKGFISGSENWYDLSASLNAHNGKTISTISLIYTGTKDQENVYIDLGEMKLSKESKFDIDFINDIEFEWVISDSEIANIRMYWEQEGNFGDRYEVYQIQNDGKEIFLGTTRTEAFFVQSVDLSQGKKFAIKNISSFDSNNYKTTIRELK